MHKNPTQYQGDDHFILNMQFLNIVIKNIFLDR
jgi:hypothetical protein